MHPQSATTTEIWTYFFVDRAAPTEIKEIMRDPYRGIGKPEPLKQALQGYWSRRITGEHRIVYRFSGDDVRIAQLRHHYRR